MTKKEAKKVFINRGFVNGLYDGDKWRESVAVISKWLEQEPCEDAISRAELLKAMDTYDKFGYAETGCFVREPKNDYVPYVHYEDMVNCVKGMPSVTPQEPILDKIRTEIEKETDRDDHADDYCDGYYDGMRKALAIIDKYKAESEPQESVTAEEVGSQK